MTFRPLPVLTLVAALAGCRTDTPEAAIRKAFQACVEAVEASDAPGVVEHLHSTFRGPEGLERPQVQLYLMGLFRQGEVGVTVLANDVEVRGRQGVQRIEVFLTQKGPGRLLPEESSRRAFQLRWELHEKTWKLKEIRES